MCRKLFILACCFLMLTAYSLVQAEVFIDNFDTPRDYITDGIDGTAWDGFIGLVDNETVNALNASIDREGSLYIESEDSWWEGAFSPRGPFLYKIVQGDFIASVEVTDFPGLPDSIQERTEHCDSFIMARVPDLDDAGPGEDFECMHYFPTWVGNMGRNYDNNSESEWGITGDNYDGARYIQLERVGNTFYFRRSFDGQTWTEITGSPVTREDLDGLPLQVGLAHSMYNANVGYVAFDNFRVEGPGVVSAGKASLPSPADGTDEVARDVTLSWKRGISAVSHDVYFGVDANDVNEAGVDDPRGVLKIQNLGVSAYDPGILGYDQTYYWRIDEVNDAEPDSPWKGEVWSFTTANYIVLDDFEDYNDFSPNEVWNTWIDGFGDPTNGSTAGYPDPDFIAGEHYVETMIRHGGKQSLPIFFDNSSAGLSEVTKTLTDVRNWTIDDIVTLTLFYYGDAGNTVLPMYIALNGTAAIVNEDPRAVLDTEWVQWDILLQDFADKGINLTGVNSITIGFGNKDNPVVGGAGHIFVDDIRLSRSLPANTEPEPESVDPGTANLVASYSFENNTQDASGNGQNATLNGGQYVAGATGYGNAISLDGANDYIALPIGSAISSMTDATVALWANFSGGGGAWQRLFDFGSSETNYMFLTPSIGTTGPMRFAIRNDDNPESMVTGTNRLPTGWHHVAVTIDGTSMELTLYLDGRAVISGPTLVLPMDMGQTTQNWLGRSQFPADAYYQGSIDEVKIYNKALSPLEVLYLAGK